MKRSLFIKAAVMLLLFTFVSGQMAFSFHEHHYAKPAKTSGDQSKKDSDECSLCQLNAHPALFSPVNLLLVKLVVSSYHYVVKNQVVGHQPVIYIRCGRGPPAKSD